MKLTWLGHSCYLLDDGKSRLVIDPYAPGSVDGLGDIDVEAERVICTHGHGDHSFKDAVRITGDPFTMDVRALPEFHDECKGRKRGPNDVFIITGSDGVKIAHMGDIGSMPTREHLEAISEADAILIPVGGFYTVDAREAKAITDAAGVNIIVPMHFRSDSFGFDVLSTLDRFTGLFENVTYLEGSSFTVDAGTPAGVIVPVPEFLKK